MRITDLQQDDRNANRGTPRGAEAIEASLRELGAGRSVLIDKDGRLIAGNKTVEAAIAAGLKDVLVVPSDGSQIIAVQRTDLSLDDAKGRLLAVADNRSSDLSLDWDADVLLELSKDIDLDPFFTQSELDALMPTVSELDGSEDETPAEPEGEPDSQARRPVFPRTAQAPVRGCDEPERRGALARRKEGGVRLHRSPVRDQHADG
jgi:hypothetical protein